METPPKLFPYEGVKEKVIDLYWRADVLLRSRKPLDAVQNVQDFCYLLGYLSALMLVCDGQAEYDLPPVLEYLEERLEYFEDASGSAQDAAK